MPSFDTFYSERDRAFGADPSEELRKFIEDTGLTGRALDLGCGDGRNSLYLANNGFHVTAVDTSAIGLQNLADVAQSQKIDDCIKTVHCDAREFEVQPAQFDLVLGVTLFDHLKPNDIKPLWERVVLTLRPGGILYVKSHTIDDPGHSKSDHNHSELSEHIHHYFDRNELLGLASDDFYVISYIETREEDTSHGDLHYHAFAKLLARKKPFDHSLLPLNRR